MNAREATIQQLDPLGGLGTRLLTLLWCAGIVLYPIVMTLTGPADEVDVPALAIMGVVVVFAASALVAVASSPLRAPLTRTVHLVAMGLAVIALGLNEASMWVSNSYIRDDWGPLVVGLVSLALSPYRPARELALVASLAAAFAAVMALLQVQHLVAPVPPAVFVIVTITPILALSLGGAAFSSTLVGLLRRWDSRVESAVHRLADESVPSLERSVQQDRVTILNRDVVPFFSQMLDRADVLDSDRTRSSQISDSIRRVMVAEVDRSWLDLVVSHAAAGRPVGVVEDPGHLAAAMTMDQRTATRATLGALFELGGFDPAAFAMRLEPQGHRVVVSIRAGFGVGESGIRSTLAPYLAVLRVVFADLRVDFSLPTMTLGFSYDKH